jgi:cation transport protein ChaC
VALLYLPRVRLAEAPRHTSRGDCGASRSRMLRLAHNGRFLDITSMDPDPLHADEDLWVFAYGSLMWRPDFPFVERVEARLVGAHRALCVYSFVHRGTPERPGLVLGLDRGGTCRGIAYHVTAAHRANTVAYLRAREQVTSVYRECMRPIWLKRDPERRVPALCYMVDRGHAQYAGRLTLEQQLHHVRQGRGQSGANRDYVIATVGALEQLGYRETALHLLAERLASARDVTAPPHPEAREMRS